MKSESKHRKSTAGKLKLRCETLRQLRDGDLADVIGGNPTRASQSFCASACDGLTCQEN